MKNCKFDSDFKQKGLVTKEHLLGRLAYPLRKGDAIQLAASIVPEGITLDSLLNLSVEHNEATAFHAAWVLDIYFQLQPKALDYFLPDLIQSFILVDNASARRLFAKMIASGIRRVVYNRVPRSFVRELWQTNLEPLQESCFTYLVDPGAKPAVKVHCMDILFLLSSRFQWISEELPGVIDAQMDACGPAVRAKGREVIKALSKKVNRTNNFI